MKSLLFKASRNILVFTLAAACIGNACSSSWIAEVDNILAAVAPALINVLNIIAVAEGKPLDAALAAKINADAANLKIVATDLSTATAAAAPTACAQTQAAANSLTADAQAVLAVVQVSSAKGTTNALLVFNAADAIVNTVVGLLPSCAAPVPVAKATFLAKAQALDSKTLLHAYNAALSKKTGLALVDAYNKNHKLPVHGRFVHIITLDRVK